MIDWDHRMDQGAPPTDGVVGSSDGRDGSTGLIAIASGTTRQPIPGGARWISYASDAPDDTIGTFLDAVAAAADAGFLSRTVRCFVAETPNNIEHPDIDLEVVPMDRLSRGLVETVIAHSRGIVLPTPHHPSPIPLASVARSGTAVMAPPHRIDDAIRPHLRGVFVDVEDAIGLHRAVRAVFNGGLVIEETEESGELARPHDSRAAAIDAQRRHHQ